VKINFFREEIFLATKISAISLSRCYARLEIHEQDKVILQSNHKENISCAAKMVLRRKPIAHNVPMLELVAAWEPSFFH